MKRPRGFSYDSEADDLITVSETEATPLDDPTTAVAEVVEVSEIVEVSEDTDGADHPTDVLEDLVPVDDTRLTEVIIPSADLSSREAEREAEREALREAKRRVKQAERDRKRRERKERRRFTQHQRARRWKGLVLGGAVLLVAAFVAVGVFTPLMAVDRVEVRGAERVEESLIVDALAGVVGTPLALVTDEDVRGALSGMPLLLSYEVEKIPPHTLRVVVKERQPVVAIPQGEQLRLVDPSGVEITKLPAAERPDGIPVAKGIGEAFESESFVALTTTLQAMPADLRERIVEISAETPQQIQLMLSDGLTVMWGDSTSNPRKAVVLESMLEALSEVAVRTIDVSSPDAPVYVPG